MNSEHTPLADQAQDRLDNAVEGMRKHAGHQDKQLILLSSIAFTGVKLVEAIEKLTKALELRGPYR